MQPHHSKVDREKTTPNTKSSTIDNDQTATQKTNTHNHTSHTSIHPPQAPQVSIPPASMRQVTNNHGDATTNLYLLVLEDLRVRGLSYVEQLTLEGEHSVPVPPNDTQTGHGQRLGRVSLGEDQGAVLTQQEGCNEATKIERNHETPSGRRSSKA